VLSRQGLADSVSGSGAAAGSQAWARVPAAVGGEHLHQQQQQQQQQGPMQYCCAASCIKTTNMARTRAAGPPP